MGYPGVIHLELLKFLFLLSHLIHPEYWWAKRNTWGCGDMADQNPTPKTHLLITQDEDDGQLGTERMDSGGCMSSRVG